MDHIRIFKAAYHMNNGIHFTDISQELISQTFALGCALYQTGDIHKFNDSRSDLLRIVKVSQKLQSFIRYGNHTHVWINGTKGIVG